MRSSGSILSRRIMRRPTNSSAILGWRSLSRRIVWRPTISISIMISYLIFVVQFRFPSPCKINISQPFICLFRDKIGVMKVRAEAIKYNKTRKFGGGFAFT